MQVAIHSGAAFTDAGLLLKSLQSNAKTLKGNGVALLGPRRFRQVFKAPLNALNEGPPSPQAIENMKAQIPGDPRFNRLVLTTTDFVGDIQTAIKDGQFFPHAGRRLALLDEVYDGHQVELFIGLRNPGSFIPKVLMALPETLRGDIIRSTDLSCLSWLTMVEDIRDLAPNVTVTLWANEDSPLIWGDIVRNLCGLKEDITLTDEFSLLSSLVSTEGQRKILDLAGQAETLGRATLLNGLAVVFEEHALTEEIEEELDYPGWSADIVGAFSELYAQDLARLKTMPGVRFLGRHSMPK